MQYTPRDLIVPTLLAKWLPRLEKSMACGIRHRIWSKLYRLWESSSAPAKLHLHGFSVMINGGNTYPFLLKKYPYFNAPLVELVYQLAAGKNRRITFVDVGAATGDTVFLLKERCPNAIREFICIEGDDEFHELLVKNMAQFSDVTLLKTLLAAQPKKVKSLVKHHRGTASATGDSWVDAIPVDSIPQLRTKEIDLLKIDVDGFDGEIISGAYATISECMPALIFEWHPALILETGNDHRQPFEVLRSLGYRRFAWFSNLGHFSHYSDVSSFDPIDRMRDYLLSVKHRQDPHFDIIAMPDDCPVSDVKLAQLERTHGW